MSIHSRVPKHHSAASAIAIRSMTYFLLFPTLCFLSAAIRLNSTAPMAKIPILSFVLLLLTAALGGLIRIGPLVRSTVTENICSNIAVTLVYVITSYIVSGTVSLKILMHAVCFALVSIFCVLLSHYASKRHRKKTKRGRHIA